MTKLAGLNTQITTAENTILSLQDQTHPAADSLNTLNPQISEKEAALDVREGATCPRWTPRSSPQSATLRGLESAKKVNRDAVAAQKAVVAGLQTQYAAVLDSIAAIDDQIVLGGCLA